MPEMIPPCVPNNRTHVCENCAHWNRGSRKRYVVQPNGQPVPVDMIPAEQRLQMISQLPSAYMAICTRFPAWDLKPGLHFCGEFERDGDKLMDKLIKNNEYGALGHRGIGNTDDE